MTAHFFLMSKRFDHTVQESQYSGGNEPTENVARKQKLHKVRASGMNLKNILLSESSQA